MHDGERRRAELVGVAQPGRVRILRLGLTLSAVFEAPGLVSGLDDLAVMGEPVEQRGRHLGVAEDGRPFAERQIGGDDDRGSFVEPADQVEEQLSAGLGERQIAEFVEHDEVEPGKIIGDAALLAVAVLGLEPVDEVDDVEEAAARSVADEGAGKADWPSALPAP